MRKPSLILGIFIGGLAGLPLIALFFHGVMIVRFGRDSIFSGSERSTGPARCSRASVTIPIPAARPGIMKSGRGFEEVPVDKAIGYHRCKGQRQAGSYPYDVC